MGSIRKWRIGSIRPKGDGRKREGKAARRKQEKKSRRAADTSPDDSDDSGDSDVSDIDVDALMAKYGLGSPVNDEPEVAPAQEQVFESSEEEEEEASPLDTIAEGSEGSDSDDSRPPSAKPKGRRAKEKRAKSRGKGDKRVVFSPSTKDHPRLREPEPEPEPEPEDVMAAEALTHYDRARALRRQGSYDVAILSYTDAIGNEHPSVPKLFPASITGLIPRAFGCLQGPGEVSERARDVPRPTVATQRGLGGLRGGRGFARGPRGSQLGRAQQPPHLHEPSAICTASLLRKSPSCHLEPRGR